RRSSSQVGPLLGGQLAPLTARHDEVTLGAGPLRTIPVRPQVALAALRALLASGTLAKTHQHTVTRDRPGGHDATPAARPYQPIPRSLQGTRPLLPNSGRCQPHTHAQLGIFHRSLMATMIAELICVISL